MEQYRFRVAYCDSCSNCCHSKYGRYQVESYKQMLQPKITDPDYRLQISVPSETRPRHISLVLKFYFEVKNSELLRSLHRSLSFCYSSSFV